MAVAVKKAENMLKNILDVRKEKQVKNNQTNEILVNLMKYQYFFVISFSMRNLYVENCRIKIYAHEQIKKLKKIIYNLL